jgi:SH3-like domain-containing protein
VIDAGTLGLRLREAPSVDANLIDYLPDGTVVTLLADVTTTPDGIEWRRVIDPQGREGWVATNYLSVNP